MLKGRVIVLGILLAALTGAYVELQNRGLVRNAEQWFLGFLVANGRQKLESGLPAQSDDVVLVKFDEKDREEYGGWPPVTLDWLMVMKRLQAFSPEIVAITEPLRWEGPAAEFVKPLRDAMLPFPSVVLGFELHLDQKTDHQVAKEFLAESLPVMRGASVGAQATVAQGIGQVPERSLRLGMQSGFSRLHGLQQADDRELMVAAIGDQLVPSFATQVVTLYRRAPFASMRLNFGAGAHLSLADEYVVPLTPQGELRISKAPEVPVINALDLLLPDLGDEASKNLSQVLGSGKVLILTSNASAALKQVKATATGLGFPALKRAQPQVEWAVAAIAALWCLYHLVWKGRLGGILHGLLLIALGTGLIMGLFQTQLMWFSPLLAFAMFLLTALFVFLFPYQPPVLDEPEDKAVDTAEV